MVIGPLKGRQTNTHKHVLRTNATRLLSNSSVAASTPRSFLATMFGGYNGEDVGCEGNGAADPKAARTPATSGSRGKNGL